jgi:hypothetical protein
MAANKDGCVKAGGSIIFSSIVNIPGATTKTIDAGQ